MFDISVYIREGRKSKTSGGKNASSNKIHIEDVKKWFRVALDIHPPNDIVKTETGVLILDPAFRNEFYLQGLRLPKGSMSGKEHQFGYNFFEGATTRDRDSLSTPGAESRQVCKIWNAAILDKGEKGAHLLEYLTDMLMKPPNEFSDVSLSTNASRLSEEVVERVWGHMLSINSSANGQSAFYYSEDDGNDISLIKNSLKQHPVTLTKSLWDLLRQYRLLRTPKEEVRHRFSRAPALSAPNEMYAQNVQWTLQCCFQSHPETGLMTFEFVDGEDLAIDMAYFERERMWKFHNKWLTFDGTHENTFCEQHEPEESDSFCCDHAVIDLWNQVLSQLAIPPIGLPSHEIALLGSITRVRISHMPRGVKCMSNRNSGELVVTWDSVDSYNNRDKPIQIRLHGKGCMYESNPLDTVPNHIERDTDCDCRVEVTEMASLSFTFTGLGTSTEYRPSVSRYLREEGAFINFPPAPDRPLPEDLVGLEPNDGDDIVDLTVDADAEESSGPIEPPSRNTTVHEADQDSLFEDPGYSATSPAPRILLKRPPLRPDVTRSHVPASNNGIDSEIAATLQDTNRAAGNATEDEYTPIDTSTLDWGGSWPGSHKFWRRNLPHPDGEVYMAMPKVPNLNEDGKRPARESAEFLTPKQARTEDTTSAGFRGRQNPLSSQSGVGSMSTPHNIAPSVRRLSRSQASCVTAASPTPAAEITYRY